MVEINAIAAKLLDQGVHAIGGNSRVLARKVTPLWLKRKISAFLATNVEFDQDTVVAKTGHKFVALHEPVFLQVRYDGIYEKELSNVMAQFVSEGNIVGDVGANFGWHSIMMAERVGAQGKVHSFEPNGEMFAALSKNIELNNFGGRVEAFNAAVGESSGTANLNADAGQSAIGYVSLEEGSGSGPEVSVMSLDDTLASHIGNIAFIKIDVEGFEPFVLKGAQKVMNSDNPPAIMVEFSPEALERQPISINDFLTDLRAIDAVMTLPIEGKLQKVDGPPLDVVTNLFFLPTKGKFATSIDKINDGLKASS